MIDDVYQGESYVQTRCLQREQNVAALMHDLIESLGYQQFDDTRARWHNNDAMAIVRLGDDFNICRTNNSGPKTWFANKTVVITDNKILFDPQYTVCKLPDSYWGIFYYQPVGAFAPEKDFHLSINRGDAQRRAIIREFVNVRGITNKDYFNYNAAHTPDTPILNRAVSFESANLQSWINLVVETYAGDDTITFSEKIFRTLQTPAPWMLYACRTTVSYLKTLGFDVLDDVVDHSYENTYQTGIDGVDKIQTWMQAAMKNLQQVKLYPDLAVRCAKAATHNQQLLLQWQQQWPSDFAAWLPGTVETLNKQLRN